METEKIETYIETAKEWLKSDNEELKELATKCLPKFKTLKTIEKTAPIRFRHFAMRLAERYNIFITYEEYLQINKSGRLKKQRYKMHSDGHIGLVGYVTIQNKEVKVCRDYNHRTLLTALPDKREKDEFKKIWALLKYKNNI